MENGLSFYSFLSRCKSLFLSNFGVASTEASILARELQFTEAFKPPVFTSLLTDITGQSASVE